MTNNNLCVCGIEFGKHPNNWSARDMKLVCINCDNPLKDSVERFRDEGNFCKDCTAKVNRALLAK